MAFYNSLRRNGKDVVAQFYKGENRRLELAHPKNTGLPLTPNSNTGRKGLI